ncbi:uncharacterized protein HMPREF1541_00178 [Cyphellophora europaea CBS 101466]|uniref:DUF7918 domain-containing protein n=1 Tax=Cyphellophora europaea (strain CBS 101466) TaxID=1220924 RepID=W2SBL1_CYPE1|nr:uncharacterized protein HMPREF1541_00178 [Cyphellophora europaea CBS 101466]ETN45995.1 hypothetical protein HMPREF1541_00178 [Cyphellophora europaea CBS 101466]
MGDVQANEYDDEDEEMPSQDNTTVKYIEVQSKADFHFEITLHPTFEWGKADTVAAYAYIDGKHSWSICLHRPKTYILEGIWTGAGSGARLLHYAFADLQAREQTAQDNLNEWQHKYGALGTLEIQMHRKRKIRTRQADSNDNATALETVESVPEKALKGKALDVATIHRPIAGRTRPSITHTEPVDMWPFAKFIFKYRTKRALQALLLRDRTPSPVPLEERAPEDLTREELIELERRRRANEAIKSDSRPVKRERTGEEKSSTAPLKKTKGLDGEIVYHFDSEDDGEVIEVAKPKRGQSGLLKDADVVALD